VDGEVAGPEPIDHELQKREADLPAVTGLVGQHEAGPFRGEPCFSHASATSSCMSIEFTSSVPYRSTICLVVSWETPWRAPRAR
jgi:hypothetical protein